MRSNTDESNFGRKCRKTFAFIYRYLTIPIFLAVFFFGFYYSNEKALDETRVAITEKNAAEYPKNIRKGIRKTRKWAILLLISGGVLFISDRVGRHKMRKLGDQLEWLVEELLHNLYHSIVEIRRGLKKALPTEGPMTPEMQKIDGFCSDELRNVSEYMQLATGFRHYTPESAKKINLSNLVCSVVTQARENEKGLKIDCSVPEKDIEVKAHLDLLATILDELMSNAVKYTDAGAITVSLEEAGNKVKLSVSDTGVGIAKEDSKRVFDLFYRSPEVKDRPGNGLGLAAVKAIVEGHYRGKVTLASTHGKGSTFTVVLPQDASAI